MVFVSRKIYISLILGELLAGRFEAPANLVLFLLALRLRAVFVGVGVVARLAALGTLVESQNGTDHLAEAVLERMRHVHARALAVVLAEAASHRRQTAGGVDGRRRRLALLALRDGQAAHVALVAHEPTQVARPVNVLAAERQLARRPRLCLAETVVARGRRRRRRTSAMLEIDCRLGLFACIV